ncbi:hypothetical protein 010DV004_251 [Bacillus phage 010DV004]|nr:hypothetical protein 010DV004_251 [Bacillus phage 010DV004]QZA69463.1 hypothetical protein 010DV005_251 [Bacillus phage 010DV005]QZA70034.1 hypothetical protein 043JT007_253 [Bacillus phage 043JT007]
MGKDNTKSTPMIATAEAVRHAHYKNWGFYTKEGILSKVSEAIVESIGEKTKTSVRFEKKYVNFKELKAAIKELDKLGYEVYTYYHEDSPNVSLEVSWGDGRKWYQKSEVILPYAVGLVIAMFVAAVLYAGFYL